MTVRFDARLLAAFRNAKHVAVLTGAGISAESGVPTFRDAQNGLWARFRPEDLATPAAFRRDPAQVWSWYAWRRSLVANAAPNAGHRALVRLATLVPDCTLMTQNVDGLHQRAGSPAVIELHGNLHRNKCFDEGVQVDEWCDDGSVPPRCPHCGGHLRPDVVWFTESLPPEALHAAVAAAASADLFLSIGTSALVHPAAQLPITALEAGAVVVEVNPDPTPITPLAAFALHGPAGTMLPALLDAAWPATGSL